MDKAAQLMMAIIEESNYEIHPITAVILAIEGLDSLNFLNRSLDRSGMTAYAKMIVDNNI